MATIGIIGTGHIGSQIARKAVELGYDVVIGNSRGPETFADLGGRTWAAGACRHRSRGRGSSRLRVVAIPLKNYRDLPAADLAGKVVIDTINYYFERDGHIAALDAGEATTSGLVQEHLKESKVAKGFKHIPAKYITTGGTPTGNENRLALATVSNYEDATKLVTRFYDEFGFDTVNIGPLSESWKVERDRSAYMVRQNTQELRDNRVKAPRAI